LQVHNIDISYESIETIVLVNVIMKLLYKEICRSAWVDWV
jgi:hypothetical protein